MKTESDLTSCEVQREICLQFPNSRQRAGLRLKVLDECFDDQGRSGADLDRPALQRLLGLIRAGIVEAMVVHRLDRLSRRVLDCASLLEEFKEHDVRLFVAAMPELAAGACDTLMLNVLSAFAEFERDMTASRISDRRAGLAARGRRIAGEKGWRTRSGRSWTPRQVIDTVGNPIYSGRLRTEGGTRTGVHEPIVDDDLFHRCAAAIAARRTSAPGPRTRRTWSHLEGKVRRARCGQLMGVRTTKNGSRRCIYFPCRKAVEGAKPWTGTQVRAHDIEERVRPILMEPGDVFQRRRGRPTEDTVTLYSLGQLMPLLDPVAERALIREVVQEIVWNAETSGVRFSLNLAVLARGFRRPIEMVMSACRPAHEYPL